MLVTYLPLLKAAETTRSGLHIACREGITLLGGQHFSGRIILHHSRSLQTFATKLAGAAKTAACEQSRVLRRSSQCRTQTTLGTVLDYCCFFCFFSSLRFTGSTSAPATQELYRACLTGLALACWAKIGNLRLLGRSVAPLQAVELGSKLELQGGVHQCRDCRQSGRVFHPWKTKLLENRNALSRQGILLTQDGVRQHPKAGPRLRRECDGAAGIKSQHLTDKRLLERKFKWEALS